VAAYANITTALGLILASSETMESEAADEAVLLYEPIHELVGRSCKDPSFYYFMNIISCLIS